MNTNKIADFEYVGTSSTTSAQWYYNNNAGNLKAPKSSEKSLVQVGRGQFIRSRGPLKG
jgi:hypothetical protein